MSKIPSFISTGHIYIPIYSIQIPLFCTSFYTLVRRMQQFLSVSEVVFMYVCPAVYFFHIFQQLSICVCIRRNPVCIMEKLQWFECYLIHEEILFLRVLAVPYRSLKPATSIFADIIMHHCIIMHQSLMIGMTSITCWLLTHYYVTLVHTLCWEFVDSFCRTDIFFYKILSLILQF